MDESEKREQEEIHAVLQEALKLPEGEILTGWIISYETIKTGDVRAAGHVYGPSGMTAWTALGLIEWTRQVTLPESTQIEDDNDE